MEAIVKVKYQRFSSSDPLDLGEALWVTHWVPGAFNCVLLYIPK